MIKKLDFKKARTISDDFGVIEDKIDEIIDVVNNLTKQIAVVELAITEINTRKINFNELEKVEHIKFNKDMNVKGNLIVKGYKEEK